jgi:ribosome-associated translation inhibitor RaiA
MAFTTEVTFRDLDPSPTLEAFARRCAARLSRVSDRIQRCDVQIELPHRHQQQGRRFHVGVVIALPGRLIAVTRDPGEDGAHDDPYVAVRDAFRAARRRLAAYTRQRMALAREQPAG